MLKKYLDYLKDNPHGYWFKRKVFGWGWVPVRWQGFVVVLFCVALVVFGMSVADMDDAPGAAGLGFLLGFGFLLLFGYLKGEKPRWQWGLPGDDDSEK